MYPLIIAALLLILLGSWLLSVRHKLSVLDENAGSAMSQIGVQLASRFDALNMLLRLPERAARRPRHFGGDSSQAGTHYSRIDPRRRGGTGRCHRPRAVPPLRCGRIPHRPCLHSGRSAVSERHERL